MTTTRRGLGIIAHIANEQWSILLGFWIFFFFADRVFSTYNEEHFCSRESSGKLYVALEDCFWSANHHGPEKGARQLVTT
jgi:hypothetical protein